MAEILGFDAFSPTEIADKVENVGVAKAHLPALPTIMLDVLAGGFIGLGALYFTLVVSDTQLSFGVARVLGGVAFSLGLILVVVGGAPSGMNLASLDWGGFAGNLIPVTLGNVVGGSVMVALVYYLVYRRGLNA